MIVNRVHLIQDACYRFAKRTGVTVTENDKGEFTLQEALDADDEFWYPKENIDTDDLESFFYMCGNYAKAKLEFPTVDINININCSNCHHCIMAPKQVALNAMEIAGVKYIVCNNCGEVFEAQDNFNVS